MSGRAGDGGAGFNPYPVTGTEIVRVIPRTGQVTNADYYTTLQQIANLAASSSTSVNIVVAASPFLNAGTINPGDTITAAAMASDGLLGGTSGHTATVVAFSSDFSLAAGPTLDLTGVTSSGTFGSSTVIPVITISSTGRVTNVTTANIPNPGTIIPGGPTSSIQYNNSNVFGGITGTYAAPTPTGTDDTTALQTLFNTISAAGGGHLILQGGTYNVTGCVFPSNCWIDGQGTEITTIQMKAGTTTSTNAVLMSSAATNSISGNAYSLFGNLFPTVSQGVEGFKISNLTISGNKANTASCDGLAIFGFAYDIENVEIENCTGDGFHGEYGALPGNVETANVQSYISWLEVHDNNSHGIRFGGPNDTVFTGCNTYRNLNINLWITTPAGSCKWIGGHCWSSDITTGRVATYACQVDTSFNILQGSHFEGGSSAQIWLRGSNNTVNACYTYFNNDTIPASVPPYYVSNPAAGVVVGDAATASFSGSINGTILTAGTPSIGALRISDTITGAGVTVSTVITGFVGTATGGAGQYYINNSQTVAGEAMTSAGNGVIGNKVDVWAENTGLGAIVFSNDLGDSNFEFLGITYGAFGYEGSHAASSRVRGVMYGATASTLIWYDPLQQAPYYSLIGTGSTSSLGIWAIDGSTIVQSNGTLSGAAGMGIGALGVVVNSGTIEIDNNVTLTGTNAGTTTIAPGSGTSWVVVNMPTTAGTVTLAAAPVFKGQRSILDIVYGATISTPSLNSGFVLTGGVPSYTPGTTPNTIDRMEIFSPDQTHWVVLALSQGGTL